MPKALPPSLSLPSPLAASSSRSTIKVSTPRGGAYAAGPQIFTSSVSIDSNSEPSSPASPSSPDTPVTAALAPRRRSPPPGTPRPVMCASVVRKRTASSGRLDGSYFGNTGEDEEMEYVLSVNLPGFMPEMVTVSARKDNRLALIADMWHSEVNCHHEWLVVFTSLDALVSRARASFSADGTLTIRVPRCASSSSFLGNFARSASDTPSPEPMSGFGLR